MDCQWSKENDSIGFLSWWRMVKLPCRKCGSFYRYGDFCNKCHSYMPYPQIDFEKDTFSIAGHAPIGRKWSKKLHRYLKADGT